MASAAVETERFPLLFRPLDVGRLRLANRLMAPPHASAINDPFGSDEQADSHFGYWKPRVEAGLGWVDGITGYIANRVPPGFDPTGLGAVTEGVFRRPVFHERAVRYAELLHANGAFATVQLLLQGGTPLGPSSRTSSYLSHQLPHVVDRDDLAWLVDELAFSARQVEAAGIDGVELHANNDDLLQWFLSPRTNVRTDGYGGSVANRTRILLEIIDGIRSAVGPRFAVGVRLVVDEMIEGGYTNDDAIEIARLLDDHGIDFLHGVVGNPWGTPTYITPPPYPPGAFAALVGRVKAEVSVPVVYTGRVTSPAVAEGILAEGQADVIGVARALISDPEFVRKAREGRQDEIRPCIGCNECIGRVLVERIPFSCSVNPHAGREAWQLPVSNGRGAGRGRLLVVGGGPAGMELAASAAEQGFSVTLWERDGELGGQLRVASRAPGLEDFARYVAHQAGRLTRLGVEVELGHEATAADVTRLGPDVVGVATGARPRRPGATGIDQPHVHDLRSVLLGETKVVGEQVVVVAEDDHVAPLAVAEALGLAGHQVHVVYPTNGPATSLGRHTLGPALARLSALDVTWTFMERVVAIDDHDVHTRNVYSGLPGSTVRADAVVLACGSEAEAGLADALRADLAGGGPAIHVLGDAYAPRRISFATRQATALVAHLVS